MLEVSFGCLKESVSFSSFLPLMEGRGRGEEGRLWNWSDVRPRLQNVTWRAALIPKVELLKRLDSCGQTESSHCSDPQYQLWPLRTLEELCGPRRVPSKARQRPLVADWWTVFFLQRVVSVNSGVPSVTISLLSPHFLCLSSSLWRQNVAKGYQTSRKQNEVHPWSNIVC